MKSNLDSLKQSKQSSVRCTFNHVEPCRKIHSKSSKAKSVRSRTISRYRNPSLVKSSKPNQTPSRQGIPSQHDATEMRTPLLKCRLEQGSNAHFRWWPCHTCTHHTSYTTHHWCLISPNNLMPNIDCWDSACTHASSPRSTAVLFIRRSIPFASESKQYEWSNKTSTTPWNIATRVQGSSVRPCSHPCSQYWVSEDRINCRTVHQPLWWWP